ncbi:ABC transporter permease [Fusibacter sp. 3D3]|uniref:ABC transporter permease n=1 Tax=Fusibacter sp. 3D3 TaxID=1048380 RepID=UPI0008531842|nr:ABC transporter permease [Fusibacter sp. 3D3]GAU76240.1 oligopeptide transport system permease protein OppB [Fusibacter sp. 3D3]
MSRKYLIKKFAYVLITLFGVLVINFFLFRVMPGDPVSMLVRNPNANVETVEKVRMQYGLDQSMFDQFFKYIANLAKGDFGTSFHYNRSVNAVIGERVFATVLLVGTAEIVAIFVGVLLGIIAAHKRGSRVDVFALSFSLVTYAMPSFWLGIILIALFSGLFGILPTSGMTSPALYFATGIQKAADVAAHLVLPALTLALVLIGEYMLVMRSALIEVLTEDYITTARAKGFDEKTILKNHALPNAMIPMVTLVAMSLGFVITGALQVETVFSWPGLGRLMYDALQSRDYPLLQGIFYISSISVIGANFISDILYGYLDPRVKE